MTSRSVGRLAAVALAPAPASADAAAGTLEAPLLLRLFLNEGGTLVSYGEYTRTPDFVVFNILRIAA